MKDEIYENYYNKIYYWSLGKLKNKEQAEDLLNDVFVEIFIYINKDIKIENIDSLIWTICYNTWKNKLRKIQKDKKLIFDEEKINKIRIEENNLDLIIYKDIINNLDVYKLTNNEKECFELYYKYNYSINEISKKLKINSSNIKYYLFNGRKKIKENYK